MRHGWLQTRNVIERKRVGLLNSIAMRQRHNAETEVARSVYTVHASKDFSISIVVGVESDERRVSTDREEAGVALERLARHAEATAKAQHRPIHHAIEEYRGFTLWLEASLFFSRAVVQLMHERDGQCITALERVISDELTARGIIASIDASLRDLQARIVRNERSNDEDTQQIAACEAELERTAVWEHAERYTHLHEHLRSLTAALRAATDKPGAAPQTPAATSTSETPASTEAQAVVVAAQEADRPNEESVPAWAMEVTFVPDDIPPAPRSLALLQAPPVEVAPVLVVVPDAQPTRITPTPSLWPQPAPTCLTSTPAAHTPRFGDSVLLRQQRRSTTSRSTQPALSPADAATQLDLFAA